MTYVLQPFQPTHEGCWSQFMEWKIEGQEERLDGEKEEFDVLIFKYLPRSTVKNQKLSF